MKIRNTALLCFLLIGKGLLANPHSPTVIAGNVEIQSSDVLQIIASDRSIIEWKDFSIEPGETTRFIQPSTDASVLNRVLEAYPSRLLGNLEANGQVLLVNPNGILVGQDAHIEMGSFIASTLDVTNAAFLAKEELSFEGASQNSIVHEGKISSNNGDVLFVGANIENRGTIQVKEGTAALLGARSVLIRPYANERIFIREVVSESSVKHFGNITAERSDGSGGEVLLAGDFIELFDGSQIDVSSKKGDGRVRIGGDLYGLNEAIPNARYVRMDADASIKANALESGTGGKIILWGKEACGFFGSIFSNGEGQGGFVEVSSKGLLAVEGKIDAKGGTILLDPTNVTIGGVNSGFVNTPCPNANFNFGANATSNISIASLTALLGNAGCTVTVDTSQSTAGSAGTITVSSGFTWGTSANLILRANNNVAINQTITSTATLGGGNLTINSGGNINVANTITSGSGAITLNSQGNITISRSIQSTLGNVVLIVPNANTITITPAVSQHAFVGSRDGTTSIGDLALVRCARSRPNISINAITTGNFCAQVGFNNAIGGTSTGPIDVVCGNLLIQSTVLGRAAIGHGNGSLPNSSFFTTDTATITVDAGGTIDLTVTPGSNTRVGASIGHGATNGPTIGNTMVLRGNICVASAGNITFTPVVFGITSGGIMNIGHGNVSGTPGVTQEAGDITVNCGGTISLNTLAGYVATIGHMSTQPQNQVDGNIFVSAVSDLMISATGATGSCGVGHIVSTVVPIPILNSNIFVSVGGNLSISNAGVGYSGIGMQAGNLTGSVSAYVAGNLTMTNSGTQAAAIGYHQTAPAGNSNTYVAVNGTITLTPSTALTPIRIRSAGDVNVGAFGNITAVRGTTPNNSYISTEYNNTAATTRIFSGGTIQSTAPAPFFLMGQTTLAAWEANIDIEAGAAVIIPYTITTDAGNVTIQTAHTFLAGDLWTTSGQQLATVDICQNPPVHCPINPLPALPACGLCINPINQASSTANMPVFAANNYQVTGITTTSGAITVAGGGCLQGIEDFSSTANPISSTTGSIAITNYHDININNLLSTGSNSIGNAANTVVNAIFLNACNDININAGGEVQDTGAGSIQMNSGNVININGLGTSISATTGPITLSANSDINDNRIISTTGGAISLTSDADDSGAGNLAITANITSGGGLITLDAGFGAGVAGTSSISQTGGEILSGGGNVIAQAVSNITFSGSPTTLDTGGGTLTVHSTNGTIAVNQDILTGGGIAMFTAGLDILVNPNGSINTGVGDLLMDARRNITINGDATSIQTTTGNIFVTADNQIDVDQVVTSTAGGFISIFSDFDNSGAGNLNILANITTVNAPISLIAGFGAGAGSTSSINQTGGTISSAGGDITAEASGEIRICGAATSISSGGGDVTLNSTHNSIQINQDVLAAGGNVTGIAGVNFNINPALAAPCNTGAGGSITTNGIGFIDIRAVNNILVNGKPNSLVTFSGPITLNAGGSINVDQTILSTSGNIFGTAGFDLNLNPISGLGQMTTGGAGIIDLTAGHNLLINGKNPSLFTVNGNISGTAINQIDIDQPVISTNGNLSFISDFDLNGFGNLNIAANVTTTAGNILLQAGDITGCFASMHTSSVNQTAGLVSTTTGNLDVNANFNINISSAGAPVVLMMTGPGYFHAQTGHEITLTNAILSKTGTGSSGATDFLMIAGLNINLVNSQITAPLSFVTLVVDNCFPDSPLIGPGAFNLDATSFIDPINLRIFTARRPQNTISGTLNGVFFVPGTLYVDTATEHWCQYFDFPFPYPFSNLGAPYTIFYKDCLQQATNQAQIIVTQFLLDLHPFNEFPGWLEEFYLRFNGDKILFDQPYYLRRRHLQVINHPKTYTLITNDSYLERKELNELL